MKNSFMPKFHEKCFVKDYDRQRFGAFSVQSVDSL